MSLQEMRDKRQQRLLQDQIQKRPSIIPSLGGPLVDSTFVWLYLDEEAQGDELRWSMRSVYANYHGEPSVILFGDKPGWYGGPHVPMPRVPEQPRRRYRDTLNKLHAACLSPEVPDSFVWMMDDTYFLRRVTVSDLLVNRHIGSIPPSPWGNKEWRGMQVDAYKMLDSVNLPKIDWCTHIPKIIEKTKFLEIWERFNLETNTVAWELLYGSMFYKEREPLNSFSLVSRRPLTKEQLETPAILNNGVLAWNEHLRAELWNRFPYPTPYEIATEETPVWEKAGISNQRYNNYELRKGYQDRPANNEGIAVPDEAQLNVYQYAATIPDIETVVDLGTGSGSKLIDLFSDKVTLGIDVSEKIVTAKERFPDRFWQELGFPINCDLLIVADVIEHLDNPMELIETIRKGNWKHCVISTPERGLARGVNDIGPPKNPRHVREWNTGEFVRFIRKQDLGHLSSVQVLGDYNLVITLTVY